MKLSAQSIDKLKKYNNKQQAQHVLEPYKTAKYYLPLTMSQQDLSILLDKNYKIIKIVNLKPW
jgi:hypothetical protein